MAFSNSPRMCNVYAVSKNSPALTSLPASSASATCIPTAAHSMIPRKRTTKNLKPLTWVLRIAVCSGVTVEVAMGSLLTNMKAKQEWQWQFAEPRAGTVLHSLRIGSVTNVCEKSSYNLALAFQDERKEVGAEDFVIRGHLSTDCCPDGLCLLYG